MKVSVITPTFRTPAAVLARTWASLRAQTYPPARWEWVVWDDTDGDEVWRQLYGLAADERYRIVAHRSHTHSGRIGEVKRRAFMVAEGELLVELDHDDELEPTALAELVSAFQNPTTGFVYSDWCEVLPDGITGRYPNGWAFGYGSDYYDRQAGVWVMRAPPINPVTIRHIVSAPNHVRAWRADCYRAVGGHDPSLEVADDYDLVVRTFVAGVGFRHVPRMLYRQHVGPHTAQRTRNEAIQLHVAQIAARWDEQITARFTP